MATSSNVPSLTSGQVDHEQLVAQGIEGTETTFQEIADLGQEIVAGTDEAAKRAEGGENLGEGSQQQLTDAEITQTVEVMVLTTVNDTLNEEADLRTIRKIKQEINENEDRAREEMLRKDEEYARQRAEKEGTLPKKGRRLTRKEKGKKIADPEPSQEEQVTPLKRKMRGVLTITPEEAAPESVLKTGDK